MNSLKQLDKIKDNFNIEQLKMMEMATIQKSAREMNEHEKKKIQSLLKIKSNQI